MEYHRTKDILYVKKILGHKRIDNTLKYIDLEAMILKPANDHFTVRVASTVQEACELIESGFEYETEIIMMAEKSFVRGSETMEKTSPYKRENGVSKSLFTSTSFNSYVKEAHKREN